MASCMGPRLKQAGHTVTGVYSRTLANAEQLAKVVGAPAFDTLESVPEADNYQYLVLIFSRKYCEMFLPT